MQYQVIVRPLSGSISGPVIDASGVLHREQVIGVIDTFSPCVGTKNTLLQDVLDLSVEPSAAQSAGLLGYLAAIEAATDTSSVETAIDEL